MGVGIIAGASGQQLQSLEEFSLNLGLAFQLADDLHDAVDDSYIDEASMVNILGKEGVKKLLSDKSKQCEKSLEIFKGKTQSLQSLVEYNLNRKN